MMDVLWFNDAWEVYKEWQQKNPSLADRIDLLVVDIMREPFKGLGKPEPLKGNYAGYWSRRITKEHRLVYKITGKKPRLTLTILRCRYHYDD